MLTNDSCRTFKIIRMALDHILRLRSHPKHITLLSPNALSQRKDLIFQQKKEQKATMRANYSLNTDGERHFKEKFQTRNGQCSKDGSKVTWRSVSNQWLKCLERCLELLGERSVTSEESNMLSRKLQFHSTHLFITSVGTP